MLQTVEPVGRLAPPVRAALTVYAPIRPLAHRARPNVAWFVWIPRQTVKTVAAVETPVSMEKPATTASAPAPRVRRYARVLVLTSSRIGSTVVLATAAVLQVNCVAAVAVRAREVQKLMKPAQETATAQRVLFVLTPTPLGRTNAA